MTESNHIKCKNVNVKIQKSLKSYFHYRKIKPSIPESLFFRKKKCKLKNLYRNTTSVREVSNICI